MSNFIHVKRVVRVDKVCELRYTTCIFNQRKISRVCRNVETRYPARVGVGRRQTKKENGESARDQLTLCAHLLHARAYGSLTWPVPKYRRYTIRLFRKGRMQFGKQ